LQLEIHARITAFQRMIFLIMYVARPQLAQSERATLDGVVAGAHVGSSADAGRVGVAPRRR